MFNFCCLLHVSNLVGSSSGRQFICSMVWFTCIGIPDAWSIQDVICIPNTEFSGDTLDTNSHITFVSVKPRGLRQRGPRAVCVSLSFTVGRTCCIACKENQLDALFILSIVRQSTSTCFGRIYSPSSGDTPYIYNNWYFLEIVSSPLCVWEIWEVWVVKHNCVTEV